MPDDRLLKPREIEILQMLADGKHISEISRDHRVSGILMAALNARTTTQAVVIAIRKGWIK